MYASNVKLDNGLVFPKHVKSMILKKKIQHASCITIYADPLGWDRTEIPIPMLLFYREVHLRLKCVINISTYFALGVVSILLVRHLEIALKALIHFLQSNLSHEKFTLTHTHTRTCCNSKKKKMFHCTFTALISVAFCHLKAVLSFGIPKLNRAPSTMLL